ncbi:MAG: hypothetical protein HY847_08460 [Betaproteobacteria bacterium]|nr:hypothetical protein [Betaproteobacteria bacterium]
MSFRHHSYLRKDHTFPQLSQKLQVVPTVAYEEFPPVSGSIGVAWFREADRLFPDMLKAADELMYEVKESGKSNIRFKPFTATSQSKN